MKKLLLFAMTGFFFAMNTNAQVSRKASPNQKVQSDSTRHQRGKMMDQLNLTPSQKSQLKALHESNKQEREAIKNDASLTQDQKRVKMKGLQKSQSEKMNSILTPEQQSKRKAYMAERKSQRKMYQKKSAAISTPPAQ